MHPAGEAPGTSPSAGGTPLIDIRDVPQMFWDASSDLLIVADHEGVLTATNPAWRNATGWVVSDSAEVRVIDLLHPNERAAAGPALAALTPGRRFEDLELRLRTIDDDYLTVSWSGFTDGTYWYIDGRDVTEQRQGAEEARAQSSLFSQLEIAVVNVGADLRITGWSVGAEQLYGWTKAEALNQQVTELIDPRPATASRAAARWSRDDSSAGPRVANAVSPRSAGPSCMTPMVSSPGP